MIGLFALLLFGLNALSAIGDIQGPSEPIGGLPSPEPPSSPGEAREPLSLRRLGPADPAGWSVFEASDRSFRIIAPGRPERDRFGGRWAFAFRGSPSVHELSVLVVRDPSAGGTRRYLARAAAFHADDLAAVEQSRRWVTYGSGDEGLEVRAERGDVRFRVRAFAAGRRAFLVTVGVEPDASDRALGEADAFLRGFELVPFG